MHNDDNILTYNKPYKQNVYWKKWHVYEMKGMASACLNYLAHYISHSFNKC